MDFSADCTLDRMQMDSKPSRAPRPLVIPALALGLASLAACFDGTFYDGPRRALALVSAGENAEGPASDTQTGYSYTLRYHGFEVDGAPRTGYLAAFLLADQVTTTGPRDNRPTLRGQIVALQGYFAERRPDWLCAVADLQLIPVDAGSRVCVVLNPEDEGASCAEPSFMNVATLIQSHPEIFNRPMPDPDLFVTAGECDAAE